MAAALPWRCPWPRPSLPQHGGCGAHGLGRPHNDGWSSAHPVTSYRGGEVEHRLREALEISEELLLLAMIHLVRKNAGAPGEVCASEKERASTPRLQFRLLYCVHRDCRYVPGYDPCNGYYMCGWDRCVAAAKMCAVCSEFMHNDGIEQHLNWVKKFCKLLREALEISEELLLLAMIHLVRKNAGAPGEVCASEKERASTPRLQFRSLYCVHRDCRYAYLNDPEVQEALHVRMTKWAGCTAEASHSMAKKRKRSSDVPAAATVEKPADSAPQRPERTLFGFKDQPDLAAEHVSKAVGLFFRNKEKVLITCSRRIIYSYRHLMQNVVSLLPHAKDSKVESRESKGSALNELVELRSCSSFLFFECRKQKDLCLLDDHVFVFSIVDDHIWFRNYQISVPHNEIDKVDKGGLDKMTLVERLQFVEGSTLQQGTCLHREGARDTLPSWPSATSNHIPGAPVLTWKSSILNFMKHFKCGDISDPVAWGFLLVSFPFTLLWEGFVHLLACQSHWMLVQIMRSF